MGRKLTPTTFLAIKSAGGLAGGFLGFVVGVAAISPAAALPLALAFGLVGLRWPGLVVTMRGRKRREDIRSQLPDALDLLAVSVEAGLGFDGAVAKLTEHMEGALAEEFSLTLGEMRIGESRHDALKKLAERCATPEVAALQPRHHPGRPTRHLPRPDPPRPGRRTRAKRQAARRGAGDEGADQDALPDGHLHLPGDVHRHPRPGDAQHPDAVLMAATEHDTEQGFGTGLRAQLEKRREADEPAAEQPEAPDTPELPPAAEAVELPDFAEAELAGLRRDLAETRAREQDARAELAELQSRREQDIPAAQAMSLRSEEVDQRAAKLAATAG